MNRIIALIFTCSTILGCANKALISGFQTNNSDVLYVGIEQPIYLQTKYENISVTTDVGEIARVDQNKYLIYPDTLPGKLKLTISNKNKKQELYFRIKPIPDISIIIRADTNVYNSSFVSVENFQSFRFLGTTLSNFDSDCYVELIKFRMKRISNMEIMESELISTPLRGPNKANSMAKRAESGDIFVFEEILVKISSKHNDSRFYFRKLDDCIFYVQ